MLSYLPSWPASQLLNKSEKLFKTELPALFSLQQRMLVQLPREHKLLVGPYPLDQLSDPQPLVVVAYAVRPPHIHTASKGRVVKPVVLALFVQDVQNKASVEAFQAQLGETFEDSRDA